jgi:hypothetical protein
MTENSSLDQFGTKMLDFLNKKGSFAPFASNSNNGILESTTKYYVQDLIGEGPLAGLVDPDGNELVLFDEGQNNSEIFKGIYLNDYAIKNHLTNTYNYNRLEIFSRAGTEFQSYLSSEGSSIADSFLFSNPGVSYSIDKTLYGLNENANAITFTSTQTHTSKLRVVKGYVPNVSNTTQSTTISKEEQNFLNSPYAGVARYQQNFYSNTSIQRTQSQPSETFDVSAFSDFNFQTCFGAYHEIKDINTDFLILSLKIQALYTFDKKGSTKPNTTNFGIKIGYKLRDDYACYIVHRVTGIASSPYQFDLFFDVSDFDFTLGPYIKVFNLDKKVGATENKVGRIIGVSSVTEITSLKFRYPNSCYFLSVFDGRGFTQPPNRQFDFKLLKIKVPENYDAESKTYDGFWNGEFDSVLRWTDNPAWILYDLITNYRYGLGKFSFQESLADKWSMYKIAKYCDELVPTDNVSRYKPVKIDSISKNSITVSSDSAIDFKVYFPVGSKIDLVNLGFIEKDEDGLTKNVSKSFKKIIVSVTKINNTSATIQLVNEFGIHRACSLFPSVKEFLKTNTKLENRYSKSLNALITAVSSPANVSSSNTVGSQNNSALTGFISYIKSQACFSDEDLANYTTVSENKGKATAEFQGFLPLVEPRFRANISLNSETDVINLLNNVASVFKGLVYWSNNFVNFDSDRPKSPAYFFNNSNVKDGIFQYSSSSKDTRYTVAKITYSDEKNNFKDQTVYVEDQINIRKYGYVEKEIIGFGVTSKSQAKRIGQWFLVTNQVEQELVSFTAGPEALLLLPGNVISVADEMKVSGRKGGRVVSISGSDIVLDDKYDFIGVGDTIAFIIPNSSISPSTLNKESEQSKSGISDARIDELSSTYIYKFTVASTGLDGNFRTKIVLNTSGLTEEEISLMQTIGASTLWIYDSKSGSSLAYSKNYRIVSIKEKTQTEFEIGAAEYEITKFNFIENNKNLAPSILFSSNQTNTTEIIPKNILADIDPIARGYVSDTSRNFDINEKYDYLIPSFDYSDDSYSGLTNVVEIFNNQIYSDITKNGGTYNSIKDLINGFVVEYVLNSKKIAYVWRKGDANSTTIALPQTEMDLSFEFLRVYIIGKSDNFLV